MCVSECVSAGGRGEKPTCIRVITISAGPRWRQENKQRVRVRRSARGRKSGRGREGRGTGCREETKRDGGGGGSGPRMGAASGREGPQSWPRVAYIPQTAPPPRKGEESRLANCSSPFRGRLNILEVLSRSEGIKSSLFGRA